MKSRNHLYAQIRTLEQLKAERHALEWHTKGVEKRMKESIPQSLGGALDDSGFAITNVLPVLIPVAITVFTLIHRIRRSSSPVTRNR